ncbi:MAG: hypothetical protein IT450_15555 [Phycisphaerales bacterium]|nr:hypothetical protein [Phycisphaerales bacterium]
MVRRIGVISSLVLSLVLFALVAVSFFDPPSVVREVWEGKWVAVDVVEGRLRIRTSTVVDCTDAELRQIVLKYASPVFLCWCTIASPLVVPTEAQLWETLGGNPWDLQRFPAFMKLIRTCEGGQTGPTARLIKFRLDVSSRQDKRWWVFESSNGTAEPGFGLSRKIHLNDEVVIMPLWVIAGVLMAWPALALFVAWLKRRMRRAGLCRSCGYDLTGNVSGACPECGRSIDSEGRREHARHSG